MSSFPGWKRTLALKKDKSAKMSVGAGVESEIQEDFSMVPQSYETPIKVTAPLARPLDFLLLLLLVLLSALCRLRVPPYPSP